MRKLLIAGLPSFCSVLWLCATQVSAQAPTFAKPGDSPVQRAPLVTPYLQLLRGGQPGLNYEYFVRPQLQVQSEINQLQQEAATAAAAPAVQSSANLPATGHPIHFMSGYQRYFNINTGRTSGAAPGAQGGSTGGGAGRPAGR